MPNVRKCDDVKQYPIPVSAIYRKYLCLPKAVVEGGKWRVDFNVTLRDGRIERWTGEGTIFPFAIGRLDRAQLEKPGTVMEAFVVE
jgi:hypothetical protein